MQEQGEHQNPAAPVQPAPVHLDPNAEEQDGLFARAQRLPTVKVMGDMIKQWKRAFTLKDIDQVSACCVCLEEFQKGQEVVELHCGKGHIFHIDCLEDWARRNKTCPLCRQDFIEIAREENNPATQNPVNRV